MSIRSPDAHATVHRVTARSVEVRNPPSITARSPSRAPGPSSATGSPSTSTASTPSSSRNISSPGVPCSVRSLPFFTLRTSGFSPAFITCSDSVRSSAVSTAVTSAGESASPHGECLPNALRYHFLNSITPVFATTVPSGPYTQWRGNGLAPVSSGSARPSAWRVSRSVLQASGAVTCTKGGWLTRRGVGTPVRPPAVCVKRTQPSPTSGSGRTSGSGKAVMVVDFEPRRIVVDPIMPPPSWPYETIFPSSTSIQAEMRLAKRNRSASRRASRSSSTSGGVVS